jgi:hypothetical protein
MKLEPTTTAFQRSTIVCWHIVREAYPSEMLSVAGRTPGALPLRASHLSSAAMLTKTDAAIPTRGMKSLSLTSTKAQTESTTAQMADHTQTHTRLVNNKEM